METPSKATWQCIKASFTARVGSVGNINAIIARSIKSLALVGLNAGANLLADADTSVKHTSDLFTHASRYRAYCVA